MMPFGVVSFGHMWSVGTIRFEDRKNMCKRNYHPVVLLTVLRSCIYYSYLVLNRRMMIWLVSTFVNLFVMFPTWNNLLGMWTQWNIIATWTFHNKLYICSVSWMCVCVCVDNRVSATTCLFTMNWVQSGCHSNFGMFWEEEALSICNSMVLSAIWD